ncbi:MAG: DUF4843 domain-containing protein, partial [Ginsengibacter sp.]
MNKVWIFWFFILTGFFLIGCKADMINYTGKAGIYFAIKGPSESGGSDSNSLAYIPKTEISFITTISKDSLVNLRVNLFGNLENRDRVFKVGIVDSATDAIGTTDYDLLEKEYTLKANTSFTNVPIKVYKTPSLKDTLRQIMLELIPTPDFDLSMKVWYPIPGQRQYSNSSGSAVINISAIRHTIIISDVITNQPEGWNASYFGAFSKKKYLLLTEWYSLTWDDFSKTNMDRNR